MNNLNFEEGDLESLEQMCRDAREAAVMHPCLAKQDATDKRHSFRFGPWNLTLTQDCFVKPHKWHASAALLQEIGTRPVELSSGLVVQAPEDALVTAESWSKEEKEQAEYLLGKLLGPYITDQHQAVNVFEGLFAIHYITEAKPEQTH